MKDLVSAEKEVDKAAWKRSESKNHAMRLLTVEFFKYLHALLGSNVLYALENEKLLQWSAVEQFYFTASVLQPVIASSKDGTARPLQNRRTS